MQNVTKPSQLLRFNSVQELTALSRTEIYRRIKNGTFPAPIKIGVRAIAWPSETIAQYIDSLASVGR